MRLASTAFVLVTLSCILPSFAQSADCAPLLSADVALRRLREGRDRRPAFTAECSIRTLNELPPFSAPLGPWKIFFQELADFFNDRYDKAPAGSEARKAYADAQLKALSVFRELTVQQLEGAATAAEASTAQLKSEYVKGVDQETNVLWKRSQDVDKGLLLLHQHLLDLDPVFLLDQTAARWVEAVRSCPNWVPVGVKALPDYAGGWCGECQDHFTDMSDKLNAWWQDRPDIQKLRSRKQLLRRDSEIAQYCKQ